MKKYRIGILGTENSHASAFAGIINKPDENGEFRYPDFKVTTVYGHYPEENEKIVKEYNIEKIATDIEEMVSEVDAVMVCARDGKFHYEFSKPFLDAGKPLFLDKPTTIVAKETEMLLKTAKENGTPVCGGSSLKYSDDIISLSNIAKATYDDICSGYIAAPVFMDSPYSGFYFYAAHLTEMCLAVFGRPRAVAATKAGMNLTVVFEFDKFNVCGMFNSTCYDYVCGIIETKKMHHRDIQLFGCSEKECDIFVEMVRTGKMKESYNYQTAPVCIMNAIERSYTTGQTTEVNYICI